ncbi:MAG: helix-hairpin-helix domain-containing protein [Prevotella sp.]|nr:helix-hairpin-helix domain-containing protein [Prevotella sp.]
MKPLVTLLLTALSFTVGAQNGDEEWKRYLDLTGVIEDVESTEWEGAYETMSEMAAHPLDINTATREDLQQLPFLSDREVEEIAEYVHRYAPLRSMGELAMIPSLSYENRQLLRHFFYIGKEKEQGFPDWKEILGNGGHTLLATGKIPLYRRRGDEEGYLGYPYRHSLRYSFDYGHYVKVGLVGAQDAGEPFFANRNKEGYDFYSFFVILRNMGRLKTLATGRYRVGYGMGLVINNDFSLGKLGMLSTLGRSLNNIRGHSSTMQANYLQGAAAKIELLKGLDLNVFASWRKIDATLTDEGFIQTIRTDGYHRTQTEMDRKNNAEQMVAGGHVNYFLRGFHAGITGTFSHLSRDLHPATTAVYRRFYADGNDIWNASVDYGYTGARLSFNGETATGSCGAVATLNSLSWKVSGELSLMAVQRFYSKKYYALFSHGFSEGGRIQNESGLYVGATWQPSRNLQLMAYSDYAYFPWPRYQVSEASHTWDHLVQMTWKPSQWKVGMRYRLKRREQDSEEGLPLRWKSEHRGRLFAEYDGGMWSSRAQGDIAYSAFSENSFGWMVSEQVQCSFQWLKASASIAYFHTDDFDSRLYAYERGLLYSFNFPVFYGEGIRYWVMAQADVMRNLAVTVKVGTTNYFDRSVIGTGYQQVNHSAITDVEIQGRVRF